MSFFETENIETEDLTEKMVDRFTVTLEHNDSEEY